MDEPEQLAPADEPRTAHDAKRIKQSDDAADSTTPALKPPATIRRVAFPEKLAVIEERNGEIEFQVVNNDGSQESTIIFTGLKCLFQKQLPQMPKDYITRLVYGRTHQSLAIVKRPLEFAEIVFCAVSSDQQVKGYGAHLMAHFKDYVKATSPVMHFLTSTIGRMLLKQKAAIRAKMQLLSKSHIIHPPPQQWTPGVTPIDPLSIPGIRQTGWSPELDALAREPRHGPHFNELRRFLNQIQNHKQAWPFVNPVNRDEKLENDSYTTPKELVHDLQLIFGWRSSCGASSRIFRSGMNYLKNNWSSQPMFALGTIYQNWCIPVFDQSSNPILFVTLCHVRDDGMNRSLVECSATPSAMR
ncbi:hypothetical protein BDV32DRAFT_135149 [Aspergillus pseudonomiae]|nr:hypothetical protein BDV32DRAFT_135149 [Aspergillus pseudonomiae]